MKNIKNISNFEVLTFQSFVIKLVLGVCFILIILLTGCKITSERLDIDPDSDKFSLVRDIEEVGGQFNRVGSFHASQTLYFDDGTTKSIVVLEDVADEQSNTERTWTDGFTLVATLFLVLERLIPVLL